MVSQAQAEGQKEEAARRAMEAAIPVASCVGLEQSLSLQAGASKPAEVRPCIKEHLAKFGGSLPNM